MAAAGLQEAHDLLMANKPEDAEHDSTTCPLCALKSSLIEPGETVSDAKYTEEDAKALVSAAVAEATAPLAAQIAALTAYEAAEAVAADKAHNVSASLSTTLPRSEINAAICGVERTRRHVAMPSVDPSR